ncbi:tRNA(Met) cytidine acetyltransferase TmcA [Pleionea sp. CnH1-48]|uniref:tRNA(Met) cytidine acetyltransferase TmcA n=1 Tax=Pleionea sp. CnH1-48 TaxID=2954494 RepID=UPI0020984CE2|nr:GNAT family N-acetyltransferase [Pleionea sp. CnH1-48]MCO7225683.1 GNAT family N-acetyltransferase [Pleionea sp. CnH1-48]
MSPIEALFDSCRSELESLLTTLKQSRFRTPVLLNMPVSDAVELLSLLHSQGILEAFALSEHPIGEFETIPLEGYRSVLGREFEHCIVNASEDVSANVIGAIAGVVKAGGILWIIVPPLEQWPELPSSEHERLFGQALSHSSRYIERLTQCIQSHPASVMINKTGIVKPFHWHYCRPGIEPVYDEQQQAIEAIKRVVNGRAKRPLVLTADRGRGKSSALGIAAAELANEHDKQIILTAPTKRSAQQAIDWFDKTVNAELSINFIAPDELIKQQPAADAVFIDEAAAIPAEQLKQLLQLYPRVVFASTIHGYEGTGRGFAIRFKSELDQQTPQWKHLELNQPIRWAPDDPLEDWINELLLLKASADEITAMESVELSSIEYRWFDSSAAIDKQWLPSVFGLLVDSHYQTSPDDLRQLMDHPERGVLVASIEGKVIGVVLVLREQITDDDLLQQISQGKRRLRGHLVPQSLAFHLLSPELAKLKSWRVQRIAVHEKLRGKRVGTELLQQVTKQALQAKVDYLSTSFAATSDLIEFWHHNKFVPIRLGRTRDKSSGCHSLLMVSWIGALNIYEWRLLSSNFFREVRLLLPRVFERLELALIFQLWKISPRGQSKGIPKHVLEEVSLYLDGARQCDDTVLSLFELIEHYFSDKSSMLQLQEPEVTFLMARFWQHKEFTALAKMFSLNGKKEAENHLKAIVGKLISLKE